MKHVDIKFFNALVSIFAMHLQWPNGGWSMIAIVSDQGIINAKGPAHKPTPLLTNPLNSTTKLQ